MSPIFSDAQELVVIEAALRGGAIALLALTVFVFLKAAPSLPGRYGSALALVAATSQLAGFAPLAGSALIGPPMQVVAGAAIPLFWIFARSWFDDGFRPGLADVALACGYVAINGAVVLQDDGAARTLRPVDMLLYCSGIAFTLDALRCAWRDRTTDLVEPRRRARIGFVVIVTLVILWSIAAEMTGRWAGAVAIAGLASSIASLVGTLALAVLLFGLRHEDMFARLPATATEPDAMPLIPQPSTDPAEDALVATLEIVMARDRLYREPDLTIGAIAARLNVPEYRVRRIVNGRFGFRNISDYLNGLRVAEVRAALADTEQAAVPILTIAMDAGFGSLAVFNRAFKSREGETPSAYRRRHLTGAPPAD